MQPNDIEDRLFNAAWNNDLEAIRAIAADSSPLPARALESALQAAAYNAKPEACELLRDLGADPNTTRPVCRPVKPFCTK